MTMERISCIAMMHRGFYSEFIGEKPSDDILSQLMPKTLNKKQVTSESSIRKQKAIPGMILCNH